MRSDSFAAWQAVLYRTLREQTLSGALTGFGMVAIGLYVTQIYNIAVVDTGLEDAFNNLPQFLQNLAGGQGGLGTADGFISSYAFGVVGPAIMIVFAIIRGGNLIAGEEDNRTLDQLLANPIGRAAAMFAKWTAMEIAMLLIAAALFLSLYFGGIIAGIELGPSGPAAGAASLFLLGSATGTIALAVGAATGNKALATSVTAVIIMLGYLINAFRTLAEVVDYFSLLSLFFYFNADGVVINGLVWWHVLALVIITLAALLAGVFYFRSRDLQ